ncbi:uncharacterized protein TNCV_1650111 [Trichonephila clavipes]|nr:uncharacterized protein TNCV_1650111 [Trichonephila clavipes]
MSTIKFKACGSPVVKVSDHGRHVMSSSPVPLKTRSVGQQCPLNLSRAETSSRWNGEVVRRGGANSGVVHVTCPWFKITWSVAKSPPVAEQCDVNIRSLTHHKIQTQHPRCKPFRKARAKSATKSSQKRVPVCYNGYTSPRKYPRYNKKAEELAKESRAYPQSPDFTTLINSNAIASRRLINNACKNSISALNSNRRIAPIIT